MKHTTMENPDIIVRDTRIVELAEVVEEVKQSEEWEKIQQITKIASSYSPDYDYDKICEEYMKEL